MRKYISLLIVICLCILLCSCDNSYTPSNTVSGDEGQLWDPLYTWKEVEQPEGVEFPLDIDKEGRVILTENTFTTKSLWEYQELLRRATLHPNFISAEKLLSIGEFDSFTITNYEGDGYCQRYYYNLKYRELPITVFVDHSGELPMESFRTLEPEKNPPDDILEGYAENGEYEVKSIIVGDDGKLYVDTSDWCTWPSVNIDDSYDYKLYIQDGRAYIYNGPLQYIGVKINGTAVYIRAERDWSRAVEGSLSEWVTALSQEPEKFLLAIGEWDQKW